MPEIHPNWSLLRERGVAAESSIDASAVRVQGLDRNTAIKIGHALTQRLGELGAYNYYATYTLERAHTDADTRTAEGDSIIFGETRPTDRNCAVSVESDSAGSYTLKADVRNDFEDKPELDGRKKLQHTFTDTIESIEL